MARKTAYLQLMLLALAVSAIAVITNPTTITFLWNECCPVDAFKLYGTTNVALPTNQWGLLAVITNAVPTNGTNYSFSMPIQPGAWFFVMTASNWWGETSPSSAVATPPVPSLLNNLQITR